MRELISPWKLEECVLVATKGTCRARRAIRDTSLGLVTRHALLVLKAWFVPEGTNPIEAYVQNPSIP